MKNVQHKGINRIIIVSNKIGWQYDNDSQSYQTVCGKEPAEVKEILNSFHIDSTAYSQPGDMCVISFDQNKQKYVLHATHQYYNKGDTEVHVSNNPDDNGIPRLTVAKYNKHDKNNVQIKKSENVYDWAKFYDKRSDAEDKRKKTSGQELAELQKEIQILSYMLESIKTRVAMLQLQQANRGNQNSL